MGSCASTKLHAATKAVIGSSGLESFGQDTGERLRIAAWVDGHFVVGFRLGKARHVESAEIWLQDLLAGKCEFKQVSREHTLRTD